MTAAGRHPKGDDAARLCLRVTPRASRDKIAGWDGQTLRVSLTAPPVDDKANRSLVAFLAKSLGVRPKSVAIVGGFAGRLKTVEIEGLSQERLAAILASLTGPRVPGERA